MVDGLLRRYLVKTTKERVIAYRYYREQWSDYWTVEKLERLHWEPLYGLVTLESSLVTNVSHGSSKRHTKKLEAKRVEFCAGISLAEELVPLSSLQDFFRRHEAYARLPLQFPLATVYTDALPWTLVEAYRRTFAHAELPSNASACFKEGKRGPMWRARKVAEDSGYIARPRACASASLVASYAMLKCEALLLQQSWYHSVLTPVQRQSSGKYPQQDFHFWVKYGSWSRCPHCGVFFFNDKFFSERVYQDQVGASTPDLLASARRIVPSDPQEHSPGQVGVSSRWWYLSGMFKPETQCGSCTRRPKASVPEGTGGRAMLALMKRMRERKCEAARAKSAARAAAAGGGGGQEVVRTGDLYKVPSTDNALMSKMASECVFWPRYRQGQFVDFGTDGESMLELTVEECRALQIVALRTQVRRCFGLAASLRVFILF